MNHRSIWTIALLSAALLSPGCYGEPTGADGGGGLRLVGVLEYHGEVAAPAGVERHFPEGSEVGYVRPAEPLEAPDTVQRGVPFTVRATTVGDGCTRADGAEVSLAGNEAEITAYDVREGEVCTMIARFLSREVTLQFDTPGSATVRLIGRRVQDGQEQARAVVVEREITVR